MINEYIVAVCGGLVFALATRPNFLQPAPTYKRRRVAGKPDSETSSMPTLLSKPVQNVDEGHPQAAPARRARRRNFKRVIYRRN